MTELLKQIPPDWLLFGGIAFGYWLAERRNFRARSAHGRRLGGLAGRVSQIEGLLRVAQPPPEEGHGE